MLNLKLEKIVTSEFTNDKTPTASGTGAIAGAEIKIYDGKTLVAVNIVKADGSWSVY